MVNKKIPLRRCIATGEQCAKKDCILFNMTIAKATKILYYRDMNHIAGGLKWNFFDFYTCRIL